MANENQAWEHKFHLVARALGFALSVSYVVVVVSIAFGGFGGLFEGDLATRESKQQVLWFLLIILSGPLVFFWVSEATKLEVTLKNVAFVAGGAYAVIIFSFFLVRGRSAGSSVRLVQVNAGDYLISNIKYVGIEPTTLTKIAEDRFTGGFLIFVFQCTNAAPDEVTLHLQYNTGEGQQWRSVAIKNAKLDSVVEAAELIAVALKD